MNVLYRRDLVYMLISETVQETYGLLHYMEEGEKMDKALLSLNEVCEYTGWGKTKAREILKRKNSNFTVRLGNRLYVNKKLFDDYLEKCAKYHIPI